MKNEDKKIIKDDLKNIKSTTFEEEVLMFIYCAQTYIKSFLVFGRNNQANQTVYNIWKEFKNIINIEKSLIDYINILNLTVLTNKNLSGSSFIRLREIFLF